MVDLTFSCKAYSKIVLDHGAGTGIFSGVCILAVMIKGASGVQKKTSFSYGNQKYSIFGTVKLNTH